MYSGTIRTGRAKLRVMALKKLGKHPIYLIYDSGHTNIPQVLEIWPNIPIYLMQAGQQSKIPIYLVPTHDYITVCY